MSQNVRHSPDMRTANVTTATPTCTRACRKAAKSDNHYIRHIFFKSTIAGGKTARSDNNNDIIATTNLSIPVGEAARNGNNRNKHLIPNVVIAVGEGPQNGSLGLPKTSVGLNGDFLANWGVTKPCSNLYNFQYRI